MAAHLPTEQEVRAALDAVLVEMKALNSANEYRYIFRRRREAWDGTNWSVTGAGRFVGRPTLIMLSEALDKVWKAMPIIR
jgi:hypothetical protein